MTELFLCQQMLKLQLQMDQSHQSQSRFRSTGLSTSMTPTDRPFLDAILKLDILFLGYLLERDLEMLSPGLHLCIFLDFLSLAPSWVLLLQRSQNYSRILRVTDIIFKKPCVSSRQASSIWSQRLKSIFQGYASNSYMDRSLCKFKLIIGRNPRSPKKITKPDVLNLIS